MLEEQKELVLKYAMEAISAFGTGQLVLYALLPQALIVMK